MFQVGDKVVWKHDYKAGRLLEIAEIRQHRGRTLITLRIALGSLIDVGEGDISRG